MTARRRVWITGLGMITPVGTGVDAFRAACAAVLLHARAGRIAAAELGVDGVIAGDVIEALPRARTAPPDR